MTNKSTFLSAIAALVLSAVAVGSAVAPASVAFAATPGASIRA